jgi:hypothetical protein
VFPARYELNSYIVFRKRLVSRSLIEHKHIIEFMKARRLRWLGHVERMVVGRGVKKIYQLKLRASRSVGRPKIGWVDVMKGVQTMKIVNWRR